MDLLELQLPKDPDMSWERDFCGDGIGTIKPTLGKGMDP